MSHSVDGWFIKERHETLSELLSHFGYIERERTVRSSKPTVGFVSIRGNSASSTSTFVALTEHWQPSHMVITSAHTVQGHSLVKYSYHVQSGADMVFRYDYDPERHLQIPSHYHTFDGSRIACTPVTSIRQALTKFDEELFKRSIQS